MSLRDVLLDEVKDLYSAEKQLIKALPKMAKGADDEMLRSSILEHLEQTKGHAQRLEQVFELLGEKAKAKHCKGMEGLIEEGQEALEEDEEPPASDVMLIGAALRVEHYEKAAYTVCVNLAKTLGEDEAANLLEQTLEEESATAEKLTARGLELMQQGASEGEEDDEEEMDEEDEEESAPAKKSASKKSSSTKSASKKSSAKKSSKR
ncbi:MAG: ferritin-like domain-containing protein [Acidobacteria bacterium]|nr:ferritin-like domain-containing protein [Acidobacteriota bacterium]